MLVSLFSLFLSLYLLLSLLLQIALTMSSLFSFLYALVSSRLLWIIFFLLPTTKTFFFSFTVPWSSLVGSFFTTPLFAPAKQGYAWIKRKPQVYDPLELLKVFLVELLCQTRGSFFLFLIFLLILSPLFPTLSSLLDSVLCSPGWPQTFCTAKDDFEQKLDLPSSGMTGMCHYTWSVQCWG